jgi:hypothetical protein
MLIVSLGTENELCEECNCVHDAHTGTSVFLSSKLQQHLEDVPALVKILVMGML